MLLSSVAEAMFWSGRYMERAQALARAIQAVEQLSLDLPSKHSPGLASLLPLVLAGKGEAPATDVSQAQALQALALEADDASSVLGALRAARENLRHARVAAPPELWVALNNQYLLLKDASKQPPSRVLDVLGSVLEAGSRIKGVVESNMARDAAHSFLNIGIELERADMLLRVLRALLPMMTANGWERTFDDVRWSGLLQALGARSMYRQRHHHQSELSTLLDFVSVDSTSPRSVSYCLRLVEDELCRLPRSGQVSAAVTVATSSAFVLAHSAPADVLEDIDATLSALASVHQAVVNCYFPELEAIVPPNSEQVEAATAGSRDPFAYLEREHAELETALRLLDELASRASRAEPVEKADLQAIVAYLTDYGELGHHEKEEAILAPKLIEHGFDWYEGPLPAMRREHRHEHMYINELAQLARHRSAWSAEDTRRFAADAHGLTHFVRAHMERERRDLFEQASRSLSDQTKNMLVQAFIDFDARQQKDLAPAKSRMAALIEHYAGRSPAAG